MPRIREPAVAGRFYPADPAELRALLQSSFARVPAAASGAACPRALIVRMRRTPVPATWRRPRLRGCASTGR